MCLCLRGADGDLHDWCFEPLPKNNEVDIVHLDIDIVHVDIDIDIYIMMQQDLQKFH